MANTIKVLDVWGNTHLIDAHQFHNTKRVQISRYAASGARFADYYASMNWHNKVTTIHRQNIASIVSA